MKVEVREVKFGPGLLVSNCYHRAEIYSSQIKTSFKRSPIAF